ncbi:MAG TPA: HutD family protein [Ramlibacter sp.]|uniref:HutD/Ves family protein n=1 Tax=Ramlibacter sp. TaxID=1917967 RepID=UPI002ED0ADBB
MNWQLVALDHAVPQPWRNGGGVTRELLTWPSASDWRVRISVADVEEAGPFSRFAGIERWFAVLAGEGVLLDIDGAPHRVTRGGAPLRFDGDAAVECQLVAGPTRDLNLMAPPGAARMQRVEGALEIRSPAFALLALHAHDTPARVQSGGAIMEVPARHLAWCLSSTAAEIAVTGTDALWMEVRT